MPTAGDLLEDAEKRLVASPHVDHPHAGKERVDAEELLAAVVGPDWDVDREVAPSEVRRFRKLLARREAGEPVGYITGNTTFSGLTLSVRPGAFIPRQSSEFTVQQAVRRLRGRRNPVLVDLATGVGPLALAVARAVPSVHVFGVDVADRPLRLARTNASRLGLGNVTFLRGDLFSPLPARLRGAVDVVTGHLPYVARGEMRELPKEIRAFEPRESLTDSSSTGLTLLERVVREAPLWLRPGGWLLIEVSPDRSRQVRALFLRAGLGEIRSTRGGVGVSRVVVGRA